MTIDLNILGLVRLYLAIFLKPWRWEKDLEGRVRGKVLRSALIVKRIRP